MSDRFARIEAARKARAEGGVQARRFARKCDVCRLRAAKWLTKGAALLCPTCADELYGSSAVLEELPPAAR